MAHDGVSDRDSVARLQASLAATLERAERAEIQLRTAYEESQRLSGRIELLEQDLAEARRDVAKSREETVAVTALAATHGARAVEMEREGVALREKAYQLGLDVTALTTERDRLALELSGMQVIIDDMTAARTHLTNELESVAKQHARGAAAAAAAEDRHKADMQQLQVRLAAVEAECRALNHAKGTMHEDLQRARTEVLALQAQLQEESRQREEQSSEVRRLQRELETVTEGLAQAQRSQRSAAATSEELEEELLRLRAEHSTQEAELQDCKETVQRLQEEVRLAAERNTDMASQVHGLSATVRHLEVENLRLSDGHAMLRVEIEARAAEARAARGEAAELAADRARLLAELQQKPAGADEDEARRLREALSASRLEIARLQRELAANDAVLADAESALVALVSEKEGLQQALSVAMMSERVAVDTAEELKAQVAALAAQEVAAQETAVNAAAKGADVLGASSVDQRMMSYLQSLHDDGRASESGHEQSSATAAARITSGNESVSSSADATASVRVVAAPAPAPVVAPRYPVQPTRSTSESGSILPNYRPGGPSDAWEALSAAGTETSGKDSGSGEGIAPSAPTGVPSATSLVIASLSLAMQAPAPQGLAAPAKDPAPIAPASRVGAALASMAGDGAVLAPAGASTQSAALLSPARATAPASSGSQGGGKDLALSDVADSATLAASVRAQGSSNGGHPVAALAAAAAPAEGAANEASPAPRSSHLPPRSPQSSIGDLREVDKASSSSASLSHGDVGLRTPGSLLASGAPQSPVPAAATGSAEPAKSPTPSWPSLSGPALLGMVSAPPLNVYRTPPPASAAQAVYQSPQPASAASDSPMGAASPAGGYSLMAAAASPGGAGTGYFSVLSAFRGPGTITSALAGRSNFSADMASALQNSAYRTPSRVSLVAPRNGAAGGTSSTNIAEGNERGTASRPTSVGGTGAVGGGGGGSGGSPMVSPRVMLEARMLSRAVRPSAEALSSPLRSSSAIPSPAAAAELAAAGQHQTPHGDGVVSGASVTLMASASRYQQQATRQQQQQQTPPPLAYRTPPSTEPDASAHPSPFASGNAAAAVASPGVVAPSPSPRASGTVRVAAPSPPPAAAYSFDVLTQRIGKEVQPPAMSSPASSIRPAVSLSFTRRNTATTPERGLAGGEAALLGPVPAAADNWQPQRQTPQMHASNGAPDPQEATGSAAASPAFLPPVPSEEDAMLLKRLAAMDEALRAIGAI